MRVILHSGKYSIYFWWEWRVMLIWLDYSEVCKHSVEVLLLFFIWVMYWIILEFWNFHDCVSSRTSFLMSCGGSCLLTRQSTAFSACHRTRDRILYLEPWITCPSPRHFMESQISKPKLTEISLICSTLQYTTLHYTTLIHLLTHSLTHSFSKLACHSGSWISFFDSWTIISA